MRPGREEGAVVEGPQHRPQAERRHRVTDRRAAEQPETRAGNEGQETAAAEEEEVGRQGRPPWRVTPVAGRSKHCCLLSLAKGLFTP